MQVSIVGVVLYFCEIKLAAFCYGFWLVQRSTLSRIDFLYIKKGGVSVSIKLDKHKSFKFEN